MTLRAGSPFEPLRHRTYRQLWAGALCLNVGLWMQTVSAGWLMTSLHGSPLLVGLVQTASTLPAFLLALPAGVIADLVHRPRFLRCAQAGLAAVALLTATLLALDLVTPGLLLVLTFAYGVGYAAQGPSWFIAQNDAVPPELRPAAVGLGAASFSSARALGPALAGALMGAVSAAAVFAGIGLLSLVSVGLLRHTAHQGASVTTSSPDGHVASPARERVGTAFRRAFEMALHDRALQRHLLRTGLFVLPGAGLWALLPLVARDRGGAAGAYGLMLACLGVGAVLGALTLAPLLHRTRMRVLETVAQLAFGAATLVASQAPTMAWFGPALLLAGVGWSWAVNASVTAIQLEAQSEMRSRALAVFLIVFQGSMALGGWLWGTAAGSAGLATTLQISAGTIAVAAVLRLAARS